MALMPDPDQLEQSLVAEAKRIAAQGVSENWLSERTWTQKLIQGLGQLGHTVGFHSCGTGCMAYGQNEWLYDLVWLALENGKAGGDIVNVPLIFEFGWLLKVVNIEEDFYKLLIGRAQHRAMIFQQPDTGEGRQCYQTTLSYRPDLFRDPERGSLSIPRLG